MLKKIFYSVIISFTLFFSTASGAKAQTMSYACVGQALAQYMNQVVDIAGNLSNVRLLSPAFNMTNPNGAAIAAGMIAAGANFGALDGIAGNAYICCGNSITGHVDAFRVASGLPSSLRVLITETGYIDGDIGQLRSELDRVQTDGSYLGALLFNAFNTNGEWERFSFDSDRQIIDEVCGGSCQKLGVNSATYYPESDGFYARAAGIWDGADSFYTLSISNADQATIDGVRMALNNGLTPIVRIGTSMSAGPDAISYGNFLVQLNSAISSSGGVVYAIAGPNEPQTECWAAPECGCDIQSDQNVKRPLSEGFYLGKYACGIGDVAEPEFHPLRPYPASSCDLLIPQSEPEAPLNNLGAYPEDFNQKADYLKYNTFACGSTLDFSYEEVFNPYDGNLEPGIGGSYDSDPETQSYRHTFCDFSEITEAELYGTGHYILPCYRTIGFEIYVDFANSNVGILGNTQNINMTDEQKMNNYLSWYFTGTPQIGDRQLLDPEEPEDMGRLVNFSGPLRKLLPYDAQGAIRDVLRLAVLEETNDIHNYALDEKGVVRLASISDTVEQYFPNIPNSSVEDVAGEAFMASEGNFSEGAFEIPLPDDWPVGVPPPTTAPFSFLVTCALGAHRNCPPTRLGIVPPEEAIGQPFIGSGTLPNCSDATEFCFSTVDCCPNLTCDTALHLCF
ncbi:hypothetical protein JXA63_04120 [Candidatus Woesebacteria bacterium]|nr:hypothetical protein [Candidatus Woesebacteria bacterium]